MLRLGFIFCILLVGLVGFDLQTAYGQSLPICPIGMDGAPNLIDPEIASGAKCRGACGEDCPSDRCDPIEHIIISVYDASGQQYNCVYNNVVRCFTHQGCRDHDACYDKCAEAGETSIYGSCHRKCNSECFDKWGYTQCGAWADIAGYVGDYWIDPDFDGYLLFSDQPELVGPIGDKQGGKTSGDNSQSALADHFPSEPFNGLQLSYSVSGATFESHTDSEGFTQRRSIEGTIEGNKLTVSGVATAENGWGATIDVRVSVDGGEDKTFHEEKFPTHGLMDDIMSQPFTVTVPIPADAKTASFTIDLTGSYNAGSRGVVVEGNLDRSSAPSSSKSIESKDVDVVEEGNSDRSSKPTGSKSIEPEKSRTSDQSSPQSSILPVDYAMASEVNEESSDVITRTNSFSTTDARAYCWLRFENVKEGHAIEWRWYSPDGNLFHIENRDIPSPKNMYTWYSIYSYLNIEGYHPENMPGDWQVDAFVDGEYIVTQHFTIGGQATIGWL